PQYVETDSGASMLTTVMLMIEVSTMIPNVMANCRMVLLIAEPCGISSSSSSDMLIVTSGMSVRPKPNMKMQKYPIMKYGELSMPTVLSKIRESVVIANPMIAIVLPPYRSYNDPETKVMTESSMVPGINKNPDRNALVSSTVCENIGSIVSVDKSSIILMKISISASVKVLFLNKSKFNTGAGSLNCLVTKNHSRNMPMSIGASTIASENP